MSVKPQLSMNQLETKGSRRYRQDRNELRKSPRDGFSTVRQIESDSRFQSLHSRSVSDRKRRYLARTKTRLRNRVVLFFYYFISLESKTAESLKSVSSSSRTII